MRVHAPDVDPQSIISVGATHFRRIVDPKDLQGVLVAYSVIIDRVFYLAAALAAMAFLSAWAMSWKRIRKEEKERKPINTTELSDSTLKGSDSPFVETGNHNV